MDTLENMWKIATIALLTLFFSSTVYAGTRVTYKSAKSTSSYYQMAVHNRQKKGPSPPQR